MADEIRTVDQGKTPTLLHAYKANELINRINVLSRVQVVIQAPATGEASSGEFKVSDGNAKLTLKLKGGGVEKNYYVVINGALYTQTFIVKGDPVAV